MAGVDHHGGTGAAELRIERDMLADHAAPGPPMSVLTTPGRHASPRVRAFTAFMVELLGR